MDNDLSVVLPIAFNCLKDALEYYKKNKHFTDEHLEIVHDMFGNVFMGATELLDNCKITLYETEDGTRKVYKISNKKEQYTIYEDINFCDCPVFRYQVLEMQNYITCKHVLAVILGDVMGNVIKERVTGSQMVDFLNEQLMSIVQS